MSPIHRVDKRQKRHDPTEHVGGYPYRQAAEDLELEVAEVVGQFVGVKVIKKQRDFSFLAAAGTALAAERTVPRVSRSGRKHVQKD